MSLTLTEQLYILYQKPMTNQRTKTSTVSQNGSQNVVQRYTACLQVYIDFLLSLYLQYTQIYCTQCLEPQKAYVAHMISKVLCLKLCSKAWETLRNDIPNSTRDRPDRSNAWSEPPSFLRPIKNILQTLVLESWPHAIIVYSSNIQKWARIYSKQWEEGVKIQNVDNKSLLGTAF